MQGLVWPEHLAREKGTSNLHVCDEHWTGSHVLESAVRKPESPPGPRHLTQVRSLPVSATSRNCCAGVPTWTRAKNCPVPLYAPDDSGMLTAVVGATASASRLPLPRDASTEAMYAYRCRSSLARSATDAPGTRSNGADVPWCSFPPSLATADAASAINTSSASRCPCNAISLSPFTSSASAVAMPAYLYRHTRSN
jgi:hypothetical protein